MIEKFRKYILKEREAIGEIISLSRTLENTSDVSERRFIRSQINELRRWVKKLNLESISYLERFSVARPLAKTPAVVKPVEKVETPKPATNVQLYGKGEKRRFEITHLEKETIKRLKKTEKKTEKEKITKPSSYVAVSSGIFSDYANKWIKKGKFKSLEREMFRANFQMVLPSYISIMFSTTAISIIVAFLIFGFFMFFNIGAALPIVTRVDESILSRFLKVFWILFAVPAMTFLIMYYYPSLERKSLENKINQELPFATVHMASISESLIEPSKIFSILISTKEYPNIEKQFTKLMNELNIYGYNLVSALRSVAFRNPSKELAELLNSLATTITSGGDLAEFFKERAQTLLFEHRLEMEKSTKTAETFMDIYISVVIAAPMILMLLLVMMRVSGLGISLSTSMITLVMILGVSTINVVFLMFLHLKQPS